ncbi:C-type lectin domain family 4 member F-like [Cloeon dipterum]|uniref:C-type lectin domain family 4 member F-like n=1 Tax=Cloeon dipterum TaxID=197152 RepID=UPI0032202D50
MRILFSVLFLGIVSASADTNLNVSLLVKRLQCEPNPLNLTSLANGKKYYFSAFEVDWYEARRFCETNKMHLAAPKTVEELALFFEETRKVTSHANWWVWAMAASDGGRSSGKFWWGDGELLAKNSVLWSGGDPNFVNKAKNVCVHVNNQANEKLRDYSCSDTHRFICQLPQYCY